MKRINSKKLYIIYKQVSNKIENQEILDVLKKKIEIDTYAISSEESAGLKTIYLFIENNQNIRIATTKLKIELNATLYAPCFESVSDKKMILRKISEKEKFLSNMDTVKNEVVLDTYQYLTSLAKTVDPSEIETILIEKFSLFYLKKGPSLSNTLKKISEHYKKKRKISTARYSLDHFKDLPEEIIKWKSTKSQNRKALVISGNSGVGKTQLAIALVVSENKNYLMLSHLEKLREFRVDVHQAIIFDDLDWSKLTREEVTHVLDTEIQRDIRTPYNCITLPDNILKIITTNKHLFCPFEKLPEIQRRMIKTTIKKPLFNNINIQCNIQYNINDKN